MVLIYTNRKSPRLQYTVELIFRDILGSPAEVTSDLSAFLASPHPKIHYGEKPASDELFLKASTLLFETGITIPEIQPVDFEGETGFFPASGDSFLPFDPFASTFFIVSRMEEYHPPARDRHGRFPATASLLYRSGLLERAVVNRWAGIIANKMEAKYGLNLFPPASFTYLPTIDVDNAWAYLHKGAFRTAGALVKELQSGNIRGFTDRALTLLHREKDPYDHYAYLRQIFSGKEQDVKFFFLLGNYGKYDKGISWKNRHFRSLISGISQKFPAGIHPSYRSGLPDGPEGIAREKKRLEKIIFKPVTSSRQHYLMLRFPETYRQLLKAGISEDYTMGYAELPGFRAGICTPYFFYDLITEKTTPLRIFPFQVMDVTLAQYMTLSPEQAILKTGELMSEVKAVNGLFCSIWHNESLSDRGIWKGYREVFEYMHKTGFSHAEE